jgi:hypothetical protein
MDTSQNFRTDNINNSDYCSDKSSVGVSIKLLSALSGALGPTLGLALLGPEMDERHYRSSRDGTRCVAFTNTLVRNPIK